MRYAVAFAILGAALAGQGAVLAVTATGWWWGVCVGEGYVGASLLTLAAGYALRQAGLPVEEALARPGWTWAWVWVLLWPYRVIALSVLWALKRLDREAAASEVAPGLWVGRWPFADEVTSLRAGGVTAVLNLCGEFRPGRWAEDVAVAAVPTLDGVPLRPADLARAVDWVAARRGEGRTVLIHCAQGHGRSATVAAAALVVLGLAPDADAALARIRAARPRARPSQAQRLALARFLAERGQGGNARSEPGAGQ